MKKSRKKTTQKKKPSSVKSKSTRRPKSTRKSKPEVVSPAVKSETETLIEMQQLSLIQGVVALGFGLIIFFWPGITLLSLLSLFAVMTLVSGILSIIFALQNKHSASWKWSLISGIVSVIVGLVVFSVPTLTAVTLVFLFASWAVIWGIARIAMSVIFKDFMYTVVGIISLIFGVFLFKNPAGGILSFMQIISFFGIVLGSILIVVSFKIKKLVAEKNK